jgi:hypothetical protein
MITLVMIVRDEQATIVDTLLSVGPHVHRACIVDTGSKDKTCELAAKTLLSLGVSHAIHRREWRDFSTNRNEALDLARKMTDPDGWLFMLSADCRLEFTLPSALDPLCDYVRPEGVTFEEFLPVRGASAVQLITLLGNWRYPQTCLFRASATAWKYRGVTHEVVMGDEPPVKPPRGVHVRYLGEGDKRARWKLDAELLRAEIARWGPNARPREVYYLAQSLECLGEWDEAAHLYDIRAHLDGFQAEAWEAKLRCTLLLEKIAGVNGNPAFTPGDVRLRLVELTKESDRAEPWYYLAEAFGDEAERTQPDAHAIPLGVLWELAYLHARIAYDITQKPIPEQAFMVRSDVYEWRTELVYAVASYHTNRLAEAKEAFSLLARKAFLGQEIQLLIRQHIAAIEEEQAHAQRADQRERRSRTSGAGKGRGEEHPAASEASFSGRRTLH